MVLTFLLILIPKSFDYTKKWQVHISTFEKCMIQIGNAYETLDSYSADCELIKTSGDDNRIPVLLGDSSVFFPICANPIGFEHLEEVVLLTVLHGVDGILSGPTISYDCSFGHFLKENIILHTGFDTFVHPQKGCTISYEYILKEIKLSKYKELTRLQLFTLLSDINNRLKSTAYCS